MDAKSTLVDITFHHAPNGGATFRVTLEDAAGSVIPSNLVVPGGPRTPHERKYIDKILSDWGPKLESRGVVRGVSNCGSYEVRVA